MVVGSMVSELMRRLGAPRDHAVRLRQLRTLDLKRGSAM